MKLYHKLTIPVVLGFALLQMSNPSSTVAAGKRVTLLMKDSTSIAGELLAVHDKTLLLCSEFALPQKVFRAHPETVLVVPLGEVLRMHVSGRRNMLAGAGIGATLGIVVGAMAGNAASSQTSDERKLNSFAGGVAGIIPGFFLGMLVGAFVETGERDIDLDDPISIKGLSEEARYQADEPDFLKRREAQEHP
jgi:hypothetical protein